VFFHLLGQCVGSSNSTKGPEQAIAWFNGANIPWDSFGYDIGTGSFNSAWFDSFFSQCQQNHVKRSFLASL